MAVTAQARLREPAPPPAGRAWRLPGLDLLSAVATAAVAVVLALLSAAGHFDPLPSVLRGAAAGFVLFTVCGAGLSLALIPRSWGPLAPLLSLPLGAAVAGLALTALGFARVPLSVSLWLVLAGALIAAALVIRGRRRAVRAAAERGQLSLSISWIAVLVALFFVAMMPAWRLGADTIYGSNPDAHQVVGIAVLFQHVPPTGTDVALPIDTVPPAWRFRYPIFYPLAAASSLAHMDPIRLFGAMAALLLVIAALGFGALAVRCLRAPPRAGPAVAAVVGISVIALHLVWHPYWNQLWGLAMMPYALLFGWVALERLDLRLGILCGLVVVMLALAYPLALPDPLVILAALAIAYRRGPGVLRALRSRSWIFAVVAVLVLAPALAGAALKLYKGLENLFSAHSSLWGGDVTSFMPVGRFVGTGGGLAVALVVAAVAVAGLRVLPRRVGIAFGAALLVLCLVDVRFRVASSGAYMDFKQLSFVGALVLTVAAAAVTRWLSSRRAPVVAAALALGVGWLVAATNQDHDEIVQTHAQVTPEMFQLRSWAGRLLPRGASVRLDIPPSGVQLWAVYMLGAHPVDSPAPVLGTTYAHAAFGFRADYSVGLAFYVAADGKIKRFPRLAYARNPPLARNAQFVLRRIVWPARLDNVPDTSSQRLVEPHP